ncbi:TonB-dependent siderophore receptor [Chenggangzhangella methanolivorans]|uniref:TonB-dependent siderophore receptor n=1 Tax=Chenggangzhangella methanolivorans TaxID=1437009 RepID=UPI003608CDAB
MTGSKGAHRTAVTAAAAAAIIVISATSIGAAERGAAPTAEIAIPAGTLEDGLLALGRQSKVRLLYASDATVGKRAKAVKADTFESALRELLEGTGLVYVYTAPGVVTVQDLVKVQATGAVELEEINVEGRGSDDAALNGQGGQNPVGHVSGFNATRAVTATKTDTPLIETPQSISVVTSDQLKTQGVESINSALRYTSGALGERNGASDTRFGGFILRGFEATGNSFYKDGLRMPGTQFTEFQGLDPYGAERIEFLKGPASVLYGQNGPGGIINYVSKRPTDYAFGEVSASIGSFDRYQGEFDFGGPVAGSDEFSYRLTGLVREGKTQVDTVDDDRIFLAPSFTWKPSDDTTLTVLGAYQRDRAGWGLQFLPADGTVFRRNGRRIPVNRFLGEPDFDRYDTDMAMIGYLFEHRFSDAVTVRQNLRYSYLKNEQDQVYGFGYVDASSNQFGRFSSVGRSELDTFAVDNNAQVKVDTGPFSHTAVIGLDYRYTSLSDFGAEGTADSIDVFDPIYGGPITVGAPYQDINTKQRQIGVYAQDQIKIDKLSIVLGGRYDWADTKSKDAVSAEPETDQMDRAFTGKAGLIYNFDNGLAPYVSYSESFLPVVASPGGTALKPDTGQQYEAGLKFQPPEWNATFTAAVFELTRQNVQQSTGPVTGNVIGEVRSRGLELEGVATLANGVNLRAAYTYLDLEITKNPSAPEREGNMTYGIPKHAGAIWADYTLQTGALKGLGFGGGVRAQSSTFGDNDNSFKVPSVAVVDALLSYKRDNYKLALNVSNLFDKRYVASCFSRDFGCFYGEGRKAILKATYTW